MKKRKYIALMENNKEVFLLVNLVFKGVFKLMKSTGVVRKVDELGRIVIPIELRRTMDIEEKDALEIFVDGDRIILKKYEPACIFCGNAEDVVNYKGKNFCDLCLNMLKATASGN
jgi:transcriptional pleiotropic regulator of transition state genes